MNNLDDAKEWIKFAQRDYDVALYLSETFKPLPIENICYGCQQAIEKALKSILIFYIGDAPKTHDIEMLQELCKEHKIDTNMSLGVTRSITRFATKSRYPDDMYELTDEDTKLALKYAKQTLDIVKQALNKAQEEASE